jgi:hypothetical protein
MDATRVVSSFRMGKARQLCAACAGKYVRRTALVGLIIWIAMVVGVRLLESFQGFDSSASRWVTWIIPIALTAQVILLAMHELAHAIAGKAFGLGVNRVRVGFGPPIIRWRVGGCAIEVNSIMLMGSCEFSGNSCLVRWRMILTTLAGPMVHLLIIVIIALIGVDAGEGMLATLWKVVFWENVELLAINLLPHRLVMFGESVASDGAQIIEILKIA